MHEQDDFARKNRQINSQLVVWRFMEEIECDLCLQDKIVFTEKDENEQNAGYS